MINKKFVIFSDKRSGTSYLGAALNKIDGVVSLGEIFKKGKKKFQWQSILEKNNVFVLREVDPVETVNSLYKGIYGKNKTVGFKIWLRQSKEAVEYLSSQKDVNIIVLERRNVLARYGSSKLAAANQTWVSKTGAHTGVTRIGFDKAEFIKFIKAHRRSFDSYKNLLLNHENVLFLDYEDDMVTGDFAEKISTFLDVGKVDLTSVASKKLTSFNILDRFGLEFHTEIIEYLESIDKVAWLEENHS
jgi:hypothetical protein